MTKLLIYIFICSSLLSFGKEKVEILPFQASFDSLVWLSDSISTNSALSNIQNNQIYQAVLKRILDHPQSFQVDFSPIKTLSVLTSPRKEFRIYTWAVSFGNNEFDYFGFTQYQRKKKKKILNYVYPLNNTGKEQANIENIKLDTNSWWGCVYYEIVPSLKRKDKNYLLIGWDGNNWMSTKKVVEVISFSSKGVPTFGAPVFKMNEGSKARPKIVTKHRLIFEYSAKVSITLRYNPEQKKIIFDHLVPSNPKLAAVKMSYVPDFSYDGLAYENKKWVHYSDLDVRNYELVKPKHWKPEDAKDRTAETLIPAKQKN